MLDGNLLHVSETCYSLVLCLGCWSSSWFVGWLGDIRLVGLWSRVDGWWISIVLRVVAHSFSWSAMAEILKYLLYKLFRYCLLIPVKTKKRNKSPWLQNNALKQADVKKLESIYTEYSWHGLSPIIPNDVKWEHTNINRIYFAYFEMSLSLWDIAVLRSLCSLRISIDFT